jgi:plastocyanin
MSNTVSTLLASFLVVGLSLPCTAGTLVAQIKDKNGGPVMNAVVYALPVGSKAPAAPSNASATVEQLYYKFDPYVSVVQAGTKIRFPNRDKNEHHIKVLSGPSAFEAKVYTRKEPDPVLFDRRGQVTLQCLLHDWMNAHIYVVDTPWFGKTSKAGSAVIENIPTGEYDVFVTHPSLLIPGQVSPAMPRRVSFDASNVHVLEARFDLVPKAEPSRRSPPSQYE